MRGIKRSGPGIWLWAGLLLATVVFPPTALATTVPTPTPGDYGDLELSIEGEASCGRRPTCAARYDNWIQQGETLAIEFDSEVLGSSVSVDLLGVSTKRGYSLFVDVDLWDSDEELSYVISNNSLDRTAVTTTTTRTDRRGRTRERTSTTYYWTLTLTDLDESLADEGIYEISISPNKGRFRSGRVNYTLGGPHTGYGDPSNGTDGGSNGETNYEGPFTTYTTWIDDGNSEYETFSVPAPSTLLLLGAGLAVGSGAVAWRRRQRSPLTSSRRSGESQATPPA